MELFCENILNPFHPSVVIHIENNHLICSAKQITGFYMNRNTGLKQVNQFGGKVPFISMLSGHGQH